MEEPQGISADNLIIQRSIESFVFKSTCPKKNKPIIRKKESHVVEPEVINTYGLSQVFEKYIIFIDEKVNNIEQLVLIAEGMGGTVKSCLDSTVNVLILEPKGPDKQKLKARYAKKGLTCVPPSWLFTCYQENRHIPFAHFPFDVKSDEFNFNVVPPSVEEDNPFGIEPVDYDYIEENQPGRQLTMERFLEPEPEPEPELELEQEIDQSYQVIDTQSEQDEQEEMQKEFFYNSKRQETPEQSQERKKAAKERKMNLLQEAENAIKNLNNVSRRTKKADRKYPPQAIDYRVEKMKIWYGEQSLPEPKKVKK